MDRNPENAEALIRDHRRQWRDCLYVYPVIARRSKGLSIGVNLNPDKRCNFACVYCQVERHVERGELGVGRKDTSGRHEMQLPILRDELREALAAARDGRLWQEQRFARTPANLRRINDIAFSGDGEPTCLANFDQAVATAADVKTQMKLDEVKLVVITNATNLDSPQIARALPILDANNGEIWAKLDAGTEGYFKRVNRSPAVTLDRIVANIAHVAQGRPVFVQTLLMNIDGAPPATDEIHAYCGRIRQITAAGGRIKLIQLHTIARKPAEPFVSALSDEELDRIAVTMRDELRDIPMETFYGATPS